MIDSQLESLLSLLDLPTTEARVYVSLLESGPKNIQEAGKKNALGRATIYKVIHGLLKKGLVEFDSKSYGKRVRAVSPRKILALIEEKERTVRKVKLKFQAKLPALEALHFQKASLKPTVYFYEGIEQMKRSWLDFLEQTGGGNTIFSFGATRISLIRAGFMGL